MILSHFNEYDLWRRPLQGRPCLDQHTGMAQCDALSLSSRSSVFQPFYDTYKDYSRSIMSGRER